MRDSRAYRSLGQVTLIAPLESDGPSHPRRISTIQQLNHATVELPGRNMHEHPGAFIRSACLLPGEKEPATASRGRIAIHAVCSLEEGEATADGFCGGGEEATADGGCWRQRRWALGGVWGREEPKNKQRGLRCDIYWQLLAPSLPATSRLI